MVPDTALQLGISIEAQRKPVLQILAQLYLIVSNQVMPLTIDPQFCVWQAHPGSIMVRSITTIPATVTSYARSCTNVVKSHEIISSVNIVDYKRMFGDWQYFVAECASRDTDH